MTGPGAPRRMKHALSRAQAVLAVERLWPALWPPLGVVLIFLAFAFLDWAAFMPGWAHAAVLAGFAAVFAAAVRRGLRGFRPVRAADARRRLERDSGLAHQPLAALEDNLALGGDDPAAQALWAAHRARAAQAAEHLNVSAPAPVMARLDPRALRAVVILAFAAGVGAVWNAGPQAGLQERLLRALAPQLGDPAARLASVRVWITPPPYTGAAPVTLNWSETETAPETALEAGPESSAPLSVPAGSAVLARIVGGDAPVLNAAGKTVLFEALNAPGGASETGAVVWRAETRIENAGAGVISVISGGAAAAWPVRVLEDRPPVIEHTADPSADGPRLRLAYAASDDYGVAGAEVVIRRAEAGAGAGVGDDDVDDEELRAALPLGRGGKAVQGVSARDFSAHIWAGTEVIVTLEAKDAPGGTGASAPFRMTLPARVFKHPAARALADARRELVTPSPDVVSAVITALDDLSSAPELFSGDTTVFLGIRVARSRLHHGAAGGVRQVQALLWDLAVRIEDGEYALAEREMLEAQDRLQQALESGADSAELERLMDELRQNLNRFLEAVRGEMARSGEDFAPLSDMRMMDAGVLAEMIERARELMRLGDMDAARQLTAQLGRMLQSLQSVMRGGSEASEMMREAREAMEGLRALAENQRALLDESFEKLRLLRSGKAESRHEGEAARVQAELRAALGDMMLGLDALMGGIPPMLGAAERAMRRAERGLNDADLPGAVRAQSDALANLQNAMEAAAEHIARRFGAMGLPAGGQNRGLHPGAASDPFGRGHGGFQGVGADDGSEITPDESEIRRAHEILEELRRRAGERRRPADEREYIDRLLQRFK
ncbi:MAG: DUF4175 domain-containing protein [Rhodospirillales bacterium]